uniref:hypothetical protein n=1 Tax=Candidatus Electronema sp. TaxID=2698783 RepID=UPI004055B7FA
MKSVQSAVLMRTVVITVVAGAVMMSTSAQAETTSRSKYTESGKGGYVYEGNGTDCGWESTSLDFSQLLSKSGYNRSTSNSGYFYSYSYNWCDGSYKSCYGYIDLSTLNMSKQDAQVQGTGAVQCYGSDSSGYWNSWPENITVDANLTCLGDYTSTSKYKDRSSYSGPWGTATYNYSGSGSYCDAKATGTITGDGGMNISLGQSSSSSGQLGEWKNRTTTIETYTP